MVGAGLKGTKETILRRKLNQKMHLFKNSDHKRKRDISCGCDTVFKGSGGQIKGVNGGGVHFESKNLEDTGKGDL